MSKVNRFVVLFLGLGVWSGLGTVAFGENILGYSAAVNARFTSGYTSGTITTPPVPNTSASFLAYGYDLSGIGWNTLDSSQSMTLISPMNVVSATHYGLTNGSTSLTFLGNNGQLYAAGLQGRTQLNSDATLGTLTAPVPTSAQVNYFPILDRGDTINSYYNTPLLVYGWYGTMGSTKISSGGWDSGTLSDDWNNPGPGKTNNAFSFYDPNGTVGVRGGDSGSPSFITYGNQITLAGTRWVTYLPTTAYNGGGDAAWMNPYTIAKTNAQMAPYGYAVKVIAVPTKNWSGANSGDFNAAGNWVEGAAPNKEGIAFDAGSANGQYNINFSATPSVKGITFTPTSGSGFTFSGSALQLGTGGIINNNAQTQTFNNNIALLYVINFDASTAPVNTGAQHWSANAGNIVVNGGVANNGFQLVVDGAKDTAIHGVIAGTGGIGKEGPGKLTLDNANQYSGNTTLSNGILAVNNATGSGTGSGNVTVLGGRLQGSGTIGGSILVRNAGILAPGNSDLGGAGKLTANNGVQLSSGAAMEFHLNGLTPGNEFDQLVVTNGNVDLGGATLNLFVGNFATTPGTEFWIVNNTGNGSLLNHFAGLNNGVGVATIGGNLFKIFYGADFAGNSLTGGNDVVLAVPEPANLAVAGALSALGLLQVARRAGRRPRPGIR